MNKIKTSIFALAFVFLGSSIASAEMRIGVSAASTYLSVDGQEDVAAVSAGTQLAKTNKKSLDSSIVIPSIFVEYGDIAGTGLSLGLDYIPLNANLSKDNFSRTDTELSQTGTEAATAVVHTQSANASINDHVTIYATFPVMGAYIKAGYARADVETDENLNTGTSYGDTTIDGLVLGLGMQGDVGGNGFLRVEGTYTDYDDVNLTGTGQTTGQTANKIKANLDATAVKLSFGYKF